MDELGFYVSSNLHHKAIRNIFYAPMSYFDTTVSRIILDEGDSNLTIDLASRPYIEHIWQRHRESV